MDSAASLAAKYGAAAGFLKAILMMLRATDVAGESLLSGLKTVPAKRTKGVWRLCLEAGLDRLRLDMTGFGLDFYRGLFDVRGQLD